MGGPAPVEPEDVLVQIDLRVLLGHAAARALQPALEVADHAVRARQDLVEVGGGDAGGSLAVRAVVVAPRAQPPVAVPAVCVHHRPGRDDLGDEDPTGQRRRSGSTIARRSFCRSIQAVS